MGWKIRPDCVIEGCDSEQATGRDWCRVHDPDRCHGLLSTATLSEDRRCKMRVVKGTDFCKRHMPSDDPPT